VYCISLTAQHSFAGSLIIYKTNTLEVKKQISINKWREDVRRSTNPMLSEKLTLKMNFREFWISKS